MGGCWVGVGWMREIELSRKADEIGGVVVARIVVMIATEYKTVAIPDQGWHSTTS